MKLDSIGQDTLTRLGVCVVVSVALLYGAEALWTAKASLSGKNTAPG